MKEGEEHVSAGTKTTLLPKKRRFSSKIPNCDNKLVFGYFLIDFGSHDIKQPVSQCKDKETASTQYTSQDIGHVKNEAIVKINLIRTIKVLKRKVCNFFRQLLLTLVERAGFLVEEDVNNMMTDMSKEVAVTYVVCRKKNMVICTGRWH